MPLNMESSFFSNRVLDSFSNKNYKINYFVLLSDSSNFFRESQSCFQKSPVTPIENSV